MKMKTKLVLGVLLFGVLAGCVTPQERAANIPYCNSNSVRHYEIAYTEDDEISQRTIYQNEFERKGWSNITIRYTTGEDNDYVMSANCYR